MGSKSMWGNIQKIKRIKVPIVYLREQADLLGEISDNLLFGEIKQRDSDDGLIIDLNIRVPALNNYTYTILTLTQNPVSLYPLKIQEFPDDYEYACNNEKEFLADLESILSSDGVKKVIQNLISQGEAIEKK